MIREAFELVKELTQQANKTETLLGFPSHVIAQRKGGDGFYLSSAIPETPHRRINYFHTFLAYVAARKECRTKSIMSSVHISANKNDMVFDPYTVPSEGSVVFFNEKQMTYVEAPHDPRSIVAVMQMTENPVFTELKASKPMDPVAFYRFLRITLRGLLGDHEAVVEPFKTIKFENSQVVNAKVSATRGQYGRDLVEDVTSGDFGGVKLPEEVNVMVQPFENVTYGEVVPFALEVDSKSGTLKLTPYPGVLQKLVENTFFDISKKLDAMEIANYCGSRASSK